MNNEEKHLWINTDKTKTLKFAQPYRWYVTIPGPERSIQDMFLELRKLPEGKSILEKYGVEFHGLEDEDEKANPKEMD